MIEAPEIDIEVGFQAHQWDAISAAEPDVCLLTGLGGGKTYTGARWIVGRACEFPESIHLATVNSYTQAQDMVIPALTDACEEMGLVYRWQAMQQRPTLFIDVGDREAEIRVRSTKEYDRLRGPEYGSWWADEARDAKKLAVDVVIGRLRCKRVDVPKSFWTTSPNGMDHIYDRFAADSIELKRYSVKRMVNGELIDVEVVVWKHPGGNRLLIQTDTRINAHVHKDYAKKLAENYDKRLLEQERGGQFVVLGKLAYYSFDRKKHVSALAIYDPRAPLIVALDFNVEPCAVVAIQERGGQTNVVGEIALEASQFEAPTPAAIREFKRKFLGHATGQGVTIHGDPSGWNRHTTTLLSDYDTWRQSLPFAAITVPKQPPFIIDRLNAVNARFETENAIRLLVHPSCTGVIKDFERVKTTIGNGGKREPDKDDNDDWLTHLSDALGYYIVAVWPCRRGITNAHRESDRGVFV